VSKAGDEGDDEAVEASTDRDGLLLLTAVLKERERWEKGMTLVDGTE
jgi:hypothetical protein